MERKAEGHRAEDKNTEGSTGRKDRVQSRTKREAPASGKKPNSN